MKDQESWADVQVAGLITPDTLRPSQFFDGAARRRRFQGEQRLMFAILEDAVQVFCKESATPGHRDSRLFREVERWIEDTDDDWLFSFDRICEALDLDAGCIRRGLRAWRKRAIPRRVALAIEEATLLRRASGE